MNAFLSKLFVLCVLNANLCLFAQNTGEPRRAIPVEPNETLPVNADAPPVTEPAETSTSNATDTQTPPAEAQNSQTEPTDVKEMPKKTESMPGEWEKKLVPEEAGDIATDEDDLTGVQIELETPVEAPAEALRGSKKLYTPFVPRPTNAPPAGWRLTRESKPKAYIKKQISLADGTNLEVEIAPFFLTSASTVQGKAFLLDEPGFDPKLKYAQTHTIGALLTRYDESLENTEKEFDEVLKELDLVLKTLPTQAPLTIPNPMP